MYQKEHYKRAPKKDSAKYAEKLKIYQEKLIKEKESKQPTPQAITKNIEKTAISAVDVYIY